MKSFINSKVILSLFFILFLTQPPESFANVQTLQNGIPEGYMLIEGDIIVPENFYELIGPLAVWNTNFWPDGIIPFVFDMNVSNQNQTLMLAAMAVWENVANVDFIPRNGENDFVRIRDSAGDIDPANSSPVGRQGGEQIINIVSWGSRFVMVHELAHSLGMWHEQSRWDRDDYIQVNWGNIQAEREHNFDMHWSADVYADKVYGLSDEQTYDFDSLMHYGQSAFSNNGQPTITVLPPNDTTWQTGIGQRTHLSTLDRLTMSFLYPQNNWYFVDQHFICIIPIWCGNFLTPYSTFDTAMSLIPNDSTLWFQPGAYPTGLLNGVLDKPTTLRAPLGNVTIVK